MLELLEIERHQRHQSIGVRGRKSVEVLFNLHFPLCTFPSANCRFALFASHPVQTENCKVEFNGGLNQIPARRPIPGVRVGGAVEEG